MSVEGKLFLAIESSMSKFLPCMCFDADVEELEGQMQKLLEKQNFVAFWDPETMLPPHTDVILEATDGRYVHAHRATLMGKSEVFKHMFAAMRDVHTPVTVKMDMEHAALEAFIHFFYTGYVKEDAMDAVADKLLRASDKYGITLLHDLCQEKLMKCIHPDCIFQHYHLGTRCHAEQLVQEITTFVATNFNDVSQITDYDQFLKDDPTLVAKLCNGVFKNLKLKLKDHIIL